jgi:hypothetical protein
MENAFTVPPEFRESFQRLLPYMSAGLRNDPQEIEAIFLYLKLGGEKLARIAIDAFNQTHRLKNAQMQKMRLEQALTSEPTENGEDEDEDEEGGSGDKVDGDDAISDF